MTTTNRALDLHQPAPPLSQFPNAEEKLIRKLRNAVRHSILDDNWPMKVAAFRKLYRLDQHDNPAIAPLSPKRQQLHAALHAEEFAEYVGMSQDSHKAFAADVAEVIAPIPLAERVDACLDLIYTLLGELLETGLTSMQINLLMQEVHASNLTKTDSNGEVVFAENGKVLKGDNYVQANIAGALASWGYTDG